MTSTAVSIESSSFRDPSARVLEIDGRILRAVSAGRAEEVSTFLDTPLAREWNANGRMVATGSAPQELAAAQHERLGFDVGLLLEHERLPFISYPYEWPFELLKRAALLHLRLQIEALEQGYAFSDASAYNVQYRGVEPVLIDVLSVRRYTEGEYWAGYRQFCEQFLNPLLLTALRGIPFQPWFRGTLDGVGVEHIAALAPLRARLSWKFLTHVTLHASMAKSARKASAFGRTPDVSRTGRPLGKAGYAAILKGLASWIAGLSQKGIGATVWEDYADRTSYDANETETKRTVIAEWAAAVRPVMLWDIGCNTGAYSELALQHGARRAIGFDFDHGALQGAVSRADARRLDLLPLYLDVNNPAPSQGWNQIERKGFSQRACADGVIALALLHHMVVGANVPLDQAIGWIMRLAPHGILEFVPANDPMIERMTINRRLDLGHYNLESVRDIVRRQAEIVTERRTTKSGRTLLVYQRASHVA